jgi:hypothetical protein
VARAVTEATRPPQEKTRWSIRAMSRHAGVSPSTVQRIWSKNDLKPHRLKTFKLSNDPKFEAKFWDTIGLYLDPPAKAPVLCRDEKSQCQALERTPLGLALAPNRTRTMTHDDVRHGTVTLFAALAQLSGKRIARNLSTIGKVGALQRTCGGTNRGHCSFLTAISELLVFDKQSNIRRATRLVSRKLRREFCGAVCG